ncbi:PEP-CTERM sorting domain-containing protein [Phycisphaera mikurensis]|uniref:Ice-binding protein C-terminal domain-containing protein n=1 Tax=Phycisphaera mikurensis (strain NBRC 102666 / KCTC 22515 / FYK2301M01) TaxID=1142394 RepID=I0IJ45_PHYMF|nr:PEP-CTERM sorting domain-containing protein [Phycisphaera mikurensis]MBB6443130.1 hypothetical protein [Phycisphaera mikurensis]BAM05283.1 hypothetical protein PSMK_31240 [Phycisphaera mikurensis NBRC 102666]
MKFLLPALAAFAAASPAAGASLQIDAGPTIGGFDAFAFTLLPEQLDGGFDTIETIVTATSGSFLTDSDTAASLLNVGDDETSFSAFLTAPSAFGGKGLSEFGYTEQSALLSGTYASLGNNSASEGDVLLSQVAFAAGTPGSGTVRVNLFDNGLVVDQITESFVVPEPASLALLAAGGVAILGRRRAA